MRALTSLFLAAALAPLPASAAPKAPDAPVTLAEQYRHVDGGRAVQIGLAQTQIETSIDIGRVAASTGGDLIGALIVSGMDDKRERLADSATERANAAAAPLRDTLRGFDVDALALSTTQAALAQPDWLQPQAISATRDVSPASRSAFAFAATTPQVAFVTYRYALSPDFTQIRVIAEVLIEAKPPAKRRAAGPLYRQTLSSIVQLGKRSYDHRENVARWNADDGKLAKAALAAGFAGIERLVPHALALTPADIKAFAAKDREKGFGAGFYGPLVARDADDPANLTLWAKDGLIHIRTLPGS
ncbi:MAG: hypothetical protein JHC57_10685 [Sphingopyxis sp.]|uniref:hypothetical protein n=1 Tax=Sphingopyxis sp. TaxID=1908224 RepID=UPI001A2A01FA|nr:hypothetical protein [Sphingopyxis sp.]MBJ7500204.1 hypothetical protein [Sphingopyxis sp.]